LLAGGGRVFDYAYIPLEPPEYEEEEWEGGDLDGWEYEYEEDDDDARGRDTARELMYERRVYTAGRPYPHLLPRGGPTEGLPLPYDG
jgi:hypothetical protein